MQLFTVNRYRARENAPSLSIFGREGPLAASTLLDLGCPENVALALVYLASRGKEASESVGGYTFQVERANY